MCVMNVCSEWYVYVFCLYVRYEHYVRMCWVRIYDMLYYVCVYICMYVMYASCVWMLCARVCTTGVCINLTTYVLMLCVYVSMCVCYYAMLCVYINMVCM